MAAGGRIPGLGADSAAKYDKMLRYFAGKEAVFPRLALVWWRTDAKDTTD
jgi:hypothetical protein